MSRTAPSPDLWQWTEIRACRESVAAARSARETAARRYRLAPHGQVQSRLRALQEATEEALRAEAALATAEQAALG